ncbi:MAG TPA: hypothetical protein VLS28_05520 [Candidatus Sulfomarinibacteraceae bacterium]|nr:hypothetical protein [Candidatus Sulfomarinibacteraceae bacterium]
MAVGNETDILLFARRGRSRLGPAGTSDGRRGRVPFGPKAGQQRHLDHSIRSPLRAVAVDSGSGRPVPAAATGCSASQPLSRLPSADADAFVAWIARSAVLAADPGAAPPIRSADPNDDYLLALAMTERAVLVSGDGHLTVLADHLPVRTPAAFLAWLDEPRS